MKVFYHSDADDKCSAFIVREHVDTEGFAEYIETDYNKQFPIWDVNPDEEVWIVDFSIDPDMMRALLEVTKNVIWIDHHISSIEKYDDFERTIMGVRSNDLSGCELTWLFVVGCIGGHRAVIPTESQLDDIPYYISLIGDRDTWKFKFGDESRYLHEAFMAAGEPSPLDIWWKNVEFNLNSELKTGEILLSHTKGLYENIIGRSAYEAEFEGHKILVCNCPIFTSELFGDRVTEYPFVAVYFYNGVNFKVSLYSVNMDVVEFAKKRGGGGHARACGFICDEVPFRKTDDK